jgi:hypothetical protein
MRRETLAAAHPNLGSPKSRVYAVARARAGPMRKMATAATTKGALKKK